jgi:hypothetical protein
VWYRIWLWLVRARADGATLARVSWDGGDHALGRFRQLWHVASLGFYMIINANSPVSKPLPDPWARLVAFTSECDTG